MLPEAAGGPLWDTGSRTRGVLGPIKRGSADVPKQLLEKTLWWGEKGS